MLNLHDEYAQYGHKVSFHKGFINTLRKHISVYTSQENLGMLSVTAKFLWLLATLHFNVSSLDQDQSLF